MENDKDLFFEWIEPQRAEYIASNLAESNWVDRPYQRNVLYAKYQYEDAEIITSIDDIDLIRQDEKRYGIRFNFYLFKGFRDKDYARDFLEGEQYLLHNSMLDTYTIHYK